MNRQCTVCGTPAVESERVCRQCGAPVAQNEESVPASGAAPVGSRMWILRAVVVAAAAAGLWAFYSDAFRSYHPVIAAQPEIGSVSASGRINSTLVVARKEGPFIIISATELRQRRIVRFFDPESVQALPVIAYLTPAGRVVTAMSISENCRSRDFYLEGENIHCASCPSYWNALSLEAYACCQKYYPDPIPSTILGDEVRIEASAIRLWQTRS